MESLRSHLLSRHLDLELHKPILSEEDYVCTFMLYNLSEQLVGYQQYNPLGNKKIFNSKSEGKYYTYKKLPTVAVWGVETLFAYREGPVFVTEGVFDAARMTEVGCAALATLCNNPPRDYRNWLMMLNRPIVVVADNDPAGKYLRRVGEYVEVCPDGKDLGDSSDEYVRYLVSKYT